MKITIKNTILLTLCVAMLLCLLPTVSLADQESGTLSVTRISGADRYATSIATSQAGWADNSCSRVVIASGKNFPDALAGVPLAKAYDCPILLVGDSLGNAAAELTRLGADEVIILGGSSAVSSYIENQITDMGLTVSRLGGSSRYETSVIIAQKCIELKGDIKTAFLVNCQNYPDALSISSVAAVQGAVILFGDPGSSLNTQTEVLIDSMNLDSITIVGGTAAIKDSVKNQIEAKGISCERVSGADRYATNIEVLKKYTDIFTSDSICVASGNGFADALTGSVYAAKFGSGMLLTNTVMNINQYYFLEQLEPDSAEIFGGTAAVSELIEERVENYGDEILDQLGSDGSVISRVGKTTGRLNMRTVAGSTSDKTIITAIPTGTTVPVYGSTEVSGTTWYQVKYSGQTGWVSGNYLLVVEDKDCSNENKNSASVSTSYDKGTVTASSLNVRKGAGTGYDSLGTISKGTVVTILGTSGDWYKVSTSLGVGYVKASYISKISSSSSFISTPSDAAFEEEIKDFPDSYKGYLRALHAKYPNWKFVAQEATDDWSIWLGMEYAFGDLLPGSWSGTKAVSLVNKNSSDSWISTDDGARDSSGNPITNWDGSSWAIASKDLIRYYMDPRNFLNEDGIFQFLDLSYSSYQTETAVSKAAYAIGADWLGETAHQHDGETTTINYPYELVTACAANNFNPIALTCIITQELGTNDVARDRNYGNSFDASGNAVYGRPQITGFLKTFTNKLGAQCNYAGYYNYINVGAYTDSTYTYAYQRALYTAKQKGWSTRQKALAGAADYFETNLINKNNNTLYYKRFNVLNGTVMGQFSTDIQGAESEGKLLAKAYKGAYGDNIGTQTLTFYIPVFKDMPANPYSLP